MWLTADLLSRGDRSSIAGRARVGWISHHEPIDRGPINRRLGKVPSGRIRPTSARHRRVLAPRDPARRLSDPATPGPNVGPRSRDVDGEGDATMKLTPPKVITWWIAVILGVLGLLGYLGTVAGLNQYSFWLVAAGLALLAVATLVRDL